MNLEMPAKKKKRPSDQEITSRTFKLKLEEGDPGVEEYKKELNTLPEKLPASFNEDVDARFQAKEAAKAKQDALDAEEEEKSKSKPTTILRKRSAPAKKKQEESKDLW